MDTKAFLTSVTFWGGITQVGVNLFPRLFPSLGLDPAGTAVYIANGIAFAITLYGRWRATKPLSLTGAQK